VRQPRSLAAACGGGEAFGEQLLVARRFGERIDPASLLAAAQPYEPVREAAAGGTDSRDSSGCAWADTPARPGRSITLTGGLTRELGLTLALLPQARTCAPEPLRERLMAEG